MFQPIKRAVRGHSHITSSPRGKGVRNDYVNVIFALFNAEFDYGRGGGGLETDKNDYVICERPLRTKDNI